MNLLDNNGLSDTAASTWIVQHHGTIHNTPSMGPTGVFGVPYYLGTNFDKQYGYGPTNPPAYTLSHLSGTSVDHRGGMSYISQNVPCIPGTHGTGAILGRDSASLMDTINLWGIAADGSPRQRLLLPFAL